MKDIYVMVLVVVLAFIIALAVTPHVLKLMEESK